MKKTTVEKNISSSLSRRLFIQSSVVTTASLTAWKIPSPFTITQNHSTPTSAPPQVVIYQDKAHFDNTGLLEPYVPPKSLASSTRKYVEKTDKQTFLSRHWFV